MSKVKSVHLQARLFNNLSAVADRNGSTVAATMVTALYNHYGIEEPQRLNRSPSKKTKVCQRQSLTISEELESRLIADAGKRTTTVSRLIQVLMCEWFKFPVTCLNPSPKPRKRKGE